MVGKFAQRKEADEDRRNKALSIADALQILTVSHLTHIADEIVETVRGAGVAIDAFVTDGSRKSGKEKYNYHQTVACARLMNYYANMSIYQSWVILQIKTDRKVEILFAFHGIGHQSSGVLGCSAMLYTRDRSQEGETVIGEPTPLSDEPFEFTYTEDNAAVQSRFQLWLDTAALTGLAAWQNLV